LDFHAGAPPTVGAVRLNYRCGPVLRSGWLGDIL